MNHNHPTIRIALYFGLLASLSAVTLLGIHITRLALHFPSISMAISSLILHIVITVYAFIALRLVCGKTTFSQLMRRWFSDRRFLAKLFLGYVSGFGILIAQIIFLHWKHLYVIESINYDYPIAFNLIYFGFVALSEETIYRGYLFEQLQDMKFPRALLLSSFLFALAHLIIPDNRTSVEAVVLALANRFAAGLVFGLSYSLSRTLWLPIGIHLAFDLFLTSFMGDADDPLRHTLYQSHSSYYADVTANVFVWSLIAMVLWAILVRRQRRTETAIKSSLLEEN